MLRRLEIKNLALVQELDLEFEPGLNLITGETGAGKSILLDALGLSLGFRAGSELLRAGADFARVQAQFEFDGSDEATWGSWLEAKGLPAQGRELWLKRELSAQGRSRTWINGESVPMAVLAEAGDLLVDFQGQHEHQSLLRQKYHLQLLDESAELGEWPAKVSRAFQAAMEIRHAMTTAGISEEERLKRMDVLGFQIREIEAAGLKEGERQQLLRQRELGQSSGKRREALASAHQALFGEGEAGLLEQLSKLGQELGRLKSMDALAWAADEARLLAAVLEIRDLADRVEHEKDVLDFDPAMAEAIESRLHLLEQLSKKYGTDEAAILEFLSRAKESLASLEDHAASREALDAKFKNALKEYRDAAVHLGTLRRDAAKTLEVSVTEELRGLGMAKAVFQVRFQVREDADGLGTGQGVEEVEFMLSANAGEPLKVLSKVASGGELSRVTLALKTVLSRSQISTLVFDEVDSGISGRVAEIVGKKLAELSRKHQVLCVTHLPQIACLPARHLRVAKRELAGQTVTEASVLDAPGRQREVAGMLSGKEISETALSHARELLLSAGH